MIKVTSRNLQISVIFQEYMQESSQGDIPRTALVKFVVVDNIYTTIPDRSAEIIYMSEPSAPI